MREFSIVHLSDLHISSAKYDPLLLRAAVQNALVTCQSPKPRVLVITGDLVDSANKDLFRESTRFLAAFREYFDHQFVIPGNHDVKKVWGSFGKGESFGDTFPEAGNLVVRAAGLHLIGVDSTPAHLAKGTVTQAEYDKMLLQTYESEASEIGEAERQGLIRIVAMHHHPLPVAAGEGVKLLGLVDDEDMMNLRASGRFLEACLSCNVSLILHGHRHAPGIVRYSVRASKPPDRYDRSTPWKDLYVLSCPSSSGQGCEAGFNVLNFSSGQRGASIRIWRFVRPDNKGAFRLLDNNLDDGCINLPFDQRVIYDVAIDVGARLAALSIHQAAELDLFPLIQRLFLRRAFNDMPEGGWGFLLYAIIRTRLVWEQEVMPRLRTSRKDPASKVRRILSKMEECVAFQAFGLNGEELTNLTTQFIDNKDEFIHHLPLAAIPFNFCDRPIERDRLALLTELDTALTELGAGGLGLEDRERRSNIED